MHNRRLCIGYVTNKPWVFQNGEVQLVTNSLIETYNLGIKNTLKPDLVHISEGVRVKTWTIEEVN